MRKLITPPSRSHGLVLLAVLAFILITSLAASTLVTSYQAQIRREKETQLLFVGDQFRRAILSYYGTVPPGGAQSLPPTLDALLTDDRFPTPRQHLRRIYADPITGAKDWVIVRVQGGITGVHSRSVEKPLKTAEFSVGYTEFEGAQSYAGWVFGIGKGRLNPG